MQHREDEVSGVYETNAFQATSSNISENSLVIFDRQ